ncbi:hypothetical protein BOTBODRAFT_174273 [Botryobasidium botryosum FD-172 SS1]|uniref:Uncharacterized protein n=1 Tax=Botryobasidium botryosum (strain FD-172 SS1) TaxID=930990 RepID=A0A067MH31_BOTB1|nr:hypothetical protein BOTBODRAFT_174273 [Botryobasidium botryosum FD-172 SS1]
MSQGHGYVLVASTAQPSVFAVITCPKSRLCTTAAKGDNSSNKTPATTPTTARPTAVASSTSKSAAKPVARPKPRPCTTAAEGDDDEIQDPCAGSFGNKAPVSHPVNGRRAATKKAVGKGAAFIPKPLDVCGGTSAKNLFAIDFCAPRPGATKDNIDNAFKERSAEHLRCASPLIELTAGIRVTRHKCPTLRRSRRSRADALALSVSAGDWQR